MKNIIKTAFLNTEHKLRNGWWIVIFIALIALTRPIYKPIKTLLSEWGVHANLLELLAPLLVLMVTYICIRLRKESMASVGLGVGQRWFRQFGIGIAAGTLMIATLCGLIYLGGGVEFRFNPNFSLTVLTTTFYLFFVGAFLEELLHRGFLFQRLIGGVGFWPAQIIVATIFAVGHWSNPGMEGHGQLIGTADLFVGSLLFGLAYYKTQSLALPIGLHLGWNWAMGSLFGFNVSGYENSGVLIPQLSDMPGWFTGGEFGLESSVVSVLVGVIAFIVLARWSGSRNTSVSFAR